MLSFEKNYSNIVSNSKQEDGTIMFQKILSKNSICSLRACLFGRCNIRFVVAFLRAYSVSQLEHSRHSSVRENKEYNR